MKYIRRVYDSLTTSSGRPEETALAFSAGVFLGFSPLLGLHTILGILVAVVFRWSKPAVLAGVWLNVPWVAVPYYTVATWLGTWVLEMQDAVVPPAFGLMGWLRPDFWKWLLSQGRLLLPAFVGSTLLAALLGLVAFPSALFVIRRFRSEHGQAREIRQTGAGPEG